MSFRQKILFFFVVVFVSTTYTQANTLVYPIQTMSKPSCRFEHFSTLGPDCKMQLPILKTSEYERYKNDEALYRRVYTVLYGASYNYGWDVGYGGHSGVDIASAAGTPVWSIAPGTVVFAGVSGTWGNVVRIEHTINGKKIYSVSAHLSKIEVSAGQNIAINTKIGEVGTTGNSTGNHLHFQIDLTETRSGAPWWRLECKEKNSWTLGNSNMCLEELRANTLDPLYFLETNGSVIPSTPTPPGQNIVVPPPPVVNIPPVNMLTREEILQREIDDFLRLNKMEIKFLNTGGNVELGKTANFLIEVTDQRRRRPFTGNFPGEMHFKYDEKKMNIFPMAIYRVENGKRELTVTPKVAGSMKLEIFLGETAFKTFNFQVFDTKKPILPKTATTIVSEKTVIGNIAPGAVIFHDTSGRKLVGVNVSGTYRLTSNTDHLVFCKKTPADFQIPCRYSDMSKTLDFTEGDLYQGLILFQYVTRGRATSTLKVADRNGKVFLQKQVTGILPPDVPSFHPYADTLARISLVVPFPGMNRNYFLPDVNISQRDARTLLQDTLFARHKACTTDDCRQEYMRMVSEVSNLPADRYTPMTRYEFVELFGRYLKKTPSGNATVFRDVSAEEQGNIAGVFGTTTWKDQFGETRYFQPKKHITRAEALFVVEMVR